jgi:hypothetical protein
MRTTRSDVGPAAGAASGLSVGGVSGSSDTSGGVGFSVSVDSLGAFGSGVSFSLVSVGSSLSAPELWAPPELRTTTPASLAVTVSDGELGVCASLVSGAVDAVPVDSEFDSEVADVEDGLDVVDVDSDDSDDFDSDEVELEEADEDGSWPSSAHAAPGALAIAPPTPKAIARAPIRPM